MVNYKIPINLWTFFSSALAASANYTSQRIAGQKNVNQKSVVAYALFGFVTI